MTIETYDPSSEDYVSLNNGALCMLIQTTPIWAVKALDERGHYFWVYSLIGFEHGEATYLNGQLPGFPRWIMYTHIPAYDLLGKNNRKLVGIIDCWRKKTMKLSNSNDRILITFLSTLLLLTGFGGMAFGQPPVGNPAIKGYDAVAYFTAGEAQKGSESFTFQWHNKTWYFQTRENRDLFATSPEKYAPQYDGYCAWALTEERKAVTDPEVWKIVNEKLYLNCSIVAYEKWSRDIPGNIKKADMNWLKLNNGN
jgi:hypothetical protein